MNMNHKITIKLLEEVSKDKLISSLSNKQTYSFYLSDALMKQIDSIIETITDFKLTRSDVVSLSLKRFISDYKKE